MGIYEDRFSQIGNYSIPTYIGGNYTMPTLISAQEKLNSYIPYTGLDITLPVQNKVNPLWNLANMENTNNKGFNWAKLVAPTAAGLASALQSPGTYYTKANWKGNGLANVDLGYAANQNYVNPYGLGLTLGGMMSDKNWQLGNWANNQYNKLKRNNNI